MHAAIRLKRRNRMGSISRFMPFLRVFTVHLDESNTRSIQCAAIFPVSHSPQSLTAHVFVTSPNNAPPQVMIIDSSDLFKNFTHVVAAVTEFAGMPEHNYMYDSSHEHKTGCDKPEGGRFVKMRTSVRDIGEFGLRHSFLVMY